LACDEQALIRPPRSRLSRGCDNLAVGTKAPPGRRTPKVDRTQEKGRELPALFLLPGFSSPSERKSLTVFSRVNKGFNHLCLFEVAVELVQLIQLLEAGTLRMKSRLNVSY
jgi:hypothetical protein